MEAVEDGPAEESIPSMSPKAVEPDLFGMPGVESVHVPQPLSGSHCGLGTVWGSADPCGSDVVSGPRGLSHLSHTARENMERRRVARSESSTGEVYSGVHDTND